MCRRTARFAASITAILLSTGAPAQDTVLTPRRCATPTEAQRVRDYYQNLRPGVPLPVPSRFLDVPELVIASGLPERQSIGTPGSPEVTKRIWRSIDEWGPNTSVKLVLTSGSKHAFAFPSLVPITQPDDKRGMLDVYADEGRGVHAHIQLALVDTVYATDLPGREPGKRTRAVSFFAREGHLILSVYASIAADATHDPAAAAGFANTWKLIGSMPRVCHID